MKHFTFSTIKKALIVILAICAFAPAFAQFSGGDGSALDPWQISNKDELIAMRSGGDWKFYVLTADIDFGGDTWETYSSDNHNFQNRLSIDGQNHVIRNMVITGNSRVAFFAELTGYVRNIGFEDITVNGANAQAVGVIAGQVWDNDGRSIENCYVKNSTVTGNGGSVGGLAGWFFSGKTTVKNCFVDAEIIGKSGVGGLFGRLNITNTSAVEKCAFYGTISYDPDSINNGGGAITGDVWKNSTQAIPASMYYPATVTGTEDQNGATALTAEQLPVQASYPALDFSTPIWKMGAKNAILNYYDEPLPSFRITYMNMGTIDNSNNAMEFTMADEVTISAPAGANDSIGGTFAGWFTNAELTDTVNVPAIAAGASGDTTFYAKWMEAPLFAEGSGSPEDPFLISSVKDLQAMKYYNVPWKNFKITADLDMTGEAWEPLRVGDHATQFRANLDGDGHVISNLTIIGKGNNIGFIKLLNGSVKNLGFENLVIDAPNSKTVGGIVAIMWNKNKHVENCYVKGGSITGKDFVGGLLGFAWSADGNTIQNNFADVDVKGESNVGGLFGRTNLMNTTAIVNNAFYGSISFNADSVDNGGGAIAGDIHAPSTETLQASNYYLGTIVGTEAQGEASAIAEEDLAKQASYPALDFTTPIWKMTDMYAVNSFFPVNLPTSAIRYMNMGTVENTNNPMEYSNVDEITLQAPAGANDSAGYVWSGWFTNAELTDTVSTPAIATGSEGEVTFYAKWVMGVVPHTISYVNVATIDNSNNPISYTMDDEITLADPTGAADSSEYIWGGWFSDAAFMDTVNTPAIALGSMGDTTFYARWIYDAPFEGAGTEDDPYLLASASDLQATRTVAAWAHYKLTADIDMAGEDWTPLTSKGQNTQFRGHMDGDMHIIKNLTVTGSGNVVGFVKELAGTIKNLGFENLNVNAPNSKTVGGIVGQMWNNNKALENCYIKGGTIAGSDFVGGLFGFAWTTGNYITNCYADVTVKGVQNVGGLFGRTHIVGTTEISNCAFYGTVEYADTSTLGGGAIAGDVFWKSTEGLPNTVYYDAAVTGTEDQGNAVALTAEQMMVQANYPALDFTTPVWKMGDKYAVLTYVDENPDALDQIAVADISIYPNPAKDVLHVGGVSANEVHIYSATGKVVKTVYNTNVIDLSKLKSGIYLVRVKNDQKKYVTKLIVK